MWKLRLMKRINHLRQRGYDKHQQQYQRFERPIDPGTRTRLELERARPSLSPCRYGRTFLFPTSKRIHRLQNNQIKRRKGISLYLLTKWSCGNCFGLPVRAMVCASPAARDVIFRERSSEIGNGVVLSSIKISLWIRFVLRLAFLKSPWGFSDRSALDNHFLISLKIF